MGPLDLLPLLSVARGWNLLAGAINFKSYMFCSHLQFQRLMRESPDLLRLCSREVTPHRIYVDYSRQVERVRQSWVRYAAARADLPMSFRKKFLLQRVNERTQPMCYRHLYRLEKEVGCPLPVCYVAMMEAACQPEEAHRQGQKAIPQLGELQWAEWTDQGGPTIKRTDSSVRLELAHLWEQSDFNGSFVHILYLEWILANGVATGTQYVLAKISEYDPQANPEQAEADIATFATFDDVLRECAREYTEQQRGGCPPVRFRLSQADAQVERSRPTHGP